MVWLFLLQFPPLLTFCWEDPWTLLTFFDQLTASVTGSTIVRLA